MKKLFAIILVLVLLTAVPLTGFAGSAYDTYVIGTWTGYAAVDGGSDSLQPHSGTTLKINSDGTCSWSFAGENMSGTWKYLSTEKAGYAYSMTVSVWESRATVVFIYSTLPELYGDLSVSVGDTIYLYHKA